jgi:hypothetical protein
LFFKKTDESGFFRYLRVRIRVKFRLFHRKTAAVSEENTNEWLTSFLCRRIQSGGKPHALHKARRVGRIFAATERFKLLGERVVHGTASVVLFMLGDGGERTHEGCARFLSGMKGKPLCRRSIQPRALFVSGEGI